MKLLIIFILSIFSVQAIKWTNIKDLKYRRLFTKGAQDRIIGGQEATRGQFPYQAAIFSDDIGFCGGSLISESAVITAAHCVYKHPKFEVILGAHVLLNGDEPGRVAVTSFNIIIHPNFQYSVSFDYDVAIITLQQPVTPGQYIKPIKLPAYSQENASFANLFGITSGWGKVDDLNALMSNTLQYVEVLIISVERCQIFLGEVADRLSICASTRFGTEGICLGDAGGPLTITDKHGEHILVGVANFGNPMGCERITPNVYARTSVYLQWISENAPGIVINP